MQQYNSLQLSPSPSALRGFPAALILVLADPKGCHPAVPQLVQGWDSTQCKSTGCSVCPTMHTVHAYTQLMVGLVMQAVNASPKVYYYTLMHVRLEMRRTKLC